MPYRISATVIADVYRSLPDRLCTESLTNSDGDGRISSDATFVSTMII